MASSGLWPCVCTSLAPPRCSAGAWAGCCLFSAAEWGGEYLVRVRRCCRPRLDAGSTRHGPFHLLAQRLLRF